MTTIRYGDITCELTSGQSVLEGLERCGAAIPSSCRAGACQTCMLEATAGQVPAAAQAGLKDTWKQRGYFLSCVCRPDENLEVRSIGAAEDVPAEVVAVDRLSPTVTRLRLRSARPFAYEPGQFVTLIREDGLARSYSLASLVDEGFLELHVRRLDGGRMSTWVHESVTPGERVVLRGPLGECFYTPGAAERPLLLVGTGTGLAPLWGIAREALRQGHGGPITLMHGALDPTGLYLRDDLVAVAAQHEAFTYVPCVVRGGGPGLQEGAIDALARARIAELPAPAQARAYLCGDPDIVARLKRVFFLAGMSIQNIFCDAFVTAAPPAGSG